MSVDLDRLIREGWLAAALALLLAIDLSILPWLSSVGTIKVGTASVSYGGSLSATDAPDGLLGVLALIAAVLIVLDVLIERFSPRTEVPAIESRELTRLVLAVAAAAFMALKFLLHLGSVTNLGVGFWLGAALVTALVLVTLRAYNAEQAAAQAHLSDERF